MKMQKMETLLRNELLEGEKLIWFGSPNVENKSMASSTRKLQTIAMINMVLGLLLMLTAFIIEILISDLQSGKKSFIFLPGFVIFVMGGMLLFALAKIAHLSLHSTLYAITNRCVIILHNNHYLSAMSFDKRAIKQVQRFEYPDGSGDLVFFLYACLSWYI